MNSRARSSAPGCRPPAAVPAGPAPAPHRPVSLSRWPATENIADLCGAVFPERRGWFREYYEESKSWMPPGLRSWAEHEDKAARLSVWAPYGNSGSCCALQAVQSGESGLAASAQK